ncbi:MAG TPA: iron-sulfur cluster insertion protein ErpA [Kaistiaceae bacterium]|nr:iron-sulfur cluster insertion protein ErpA [Kaistiaceae bacterium]
MSDAFTDLDTSDELRLDDRTIEDEITITERAVRRIAKVLAAEAPGTALRIAVEGGGCSGFQYRFDFDTARNEEDFILEADGAVVIVDSMSLMYMRGSEIDFVDDLMGQAFHINNPQAVASCGCGTSFSV